MAEIPSIHISDYSYELPQEKIAKYPLAERDQSKLLIWKDGKISESIFSDIDQALPENSMLISNNTRVIHARLLFQQITGSRIEIFCLEPLEPKDYQLSFRQYSTVEWKCLVGNAKKWKRGTLTKSVTSEGKTFGLQAEITGKSGDTFTVRFSWDQQVTFAEIIEVAGHIPIPPYLNRPDEESDVSRYQTTYAKIDGSVAAPTAGFHFTETVLQKLAVKGIRFSGLTLHVGAGTFQPVKSEDVTLHRMHSETVFVERDLLLQIIHHPGKIIAVGTTSVRSLESLFWLGLKAASLVPGQIPKVDQWEPYRDVDNTDNRKTLQNLLDFMDLQGIGQLTFTTSIIIVPGYRFRMTDGMITNFHQPGSTLLLLIAAFLGPDWQKVYDFALLNNFRFLSYGDSNLYLRGRERMRVP